MALRWIFVACTVGLTIGDDVTLLGVGYQVIKAAIRTDANLSSESVSNGSFNASLSPWQWLQGSKPVEEHAKHRRKHADVSSEAVSDAEEEEQTEESIPQEDKELEEEIKENGAEVSQAVIEAAKAIEMRDEADEKFQAAVSKMNKSQSEEEATNLPLDPEKLERQLEEPTDVDALKEDVMEAAEADVNEAAEAAEAVADKINAEEDLELALQKARQKIDELEGLLGEAQDRPHHNQGWSGKHGAVLLAGLVCAMAVFAVGLLTARTCNLDWSTAKALPVTHDAG